MKPPIQRNGSTESPSTIERVSRWARRLSCSLLIVLLVTPAAGASFLLNGGAEAGDLTGWTLNAGDSLFRAATQGDIGQAPLEGGWMFTSVYDMGSYASMSQTGTSGLDGGALSLTGWVMHEQSYGDCGQAWLRIYGQESQLLASATTGSLDAGQNWVWAPFQLGLDVPSGASRWEVEMISTKGGGGNFPDVYFDALVLGNSFSNVPEPSTYALIVGCGLMGFSGYRRFRKNHAAASPAGGPR